MRLTTAIGLEESDATNRASGAALEDATRYALTGSGGENGSSRELGGAADYVDDGHHNASGATSSRAKYERSTSQASNSSNGRRRLSEARSSLTSDFAAEQVTATLATATSAERMVSRRENTNARNMSRKVSQRLSFMADRNIEQTKPPPRRRAGEETVEDRLIREWILRQAREQAALEATRKRELDARNGRLLSREEIEQNLERMKQRDIETAKRAEARRQAADEEARNLASSSISSMLSKKTRSLSSKMPEFNARQREFMTRRAERIEQRRREINQEKQTKEAAADFAKKRDRVPITRQAAATHRTLQDLESWNERREEKIRAAKAKVAADEAASSTFAPSLDKHSLRLALRRRAAGFDCTGSVGEAPSKESHDFTFTPSINKHSTRIASQNNAAETPVFDRLYSAKSARRTPSGTPRNKSPTERWGGYGVDEPDVLKVVARDGFIHLNELGDD